MQAPPRPNSQVIHTSPLALAPSSRAEVWVDYSDQLLPDARALDQLGLELALRLELLPLQSAGAVTPLAGTSRRLFDRHRSHLEKILGPVCFCRCEADNLRKALLGLRSAYLVRRAEERTPLVESCRAWSGLRVLVIAGVLFALIGLGLLLKPSVLILFFAGWATLTLAATTFIRSVAALAEFLHRRRVRKFWTSRRQRTIRRDLLPRIGLLVPLLDERDIAGRLVRRLERLDYPRDRLQVSLILEADDKRTSEALEQTVLPDWMQVVRVPQGTLKTKPRAMNFALDFTEGEIIGIYDAEDAPAAGQLLDVAAGFARSGSNVGCLQGILDFYNPRQTWLTRCFTIDYASWFRLVLPGLVRLGFAIPLGGTNVFFRRKVLEEIGRWDAHNVTEDADLGFRLARHGYRTEFVYSVTEEEATATVRAWIKQRSRWIKGYAITWAVHMRDPLALLGELGWRRFWGFQVLFLGSLSQFLLAPLLWSFWLVPFGFPHPVTDALPWSVVVIGASIFFFCELATMALAAVGVATPKHNWLIKWVPVMHLYFPLAAIASWKGFAELIRQPFFWDKTAHGGKVTRRWGYPSRLRRRHRDEDALQTPG